MSFSDGYDRNALNLERIEKERKLGNNRGINPNQAPHEDLL
jgi:hypothetical protein